MLGWSTTPLKRADQKRFDCYEPRPFLPQTNFWARWSFVFALIGLIPFIGVVSGTFAVITGWVGIRRIFKSGMAEGLSHARLAVYLGLFEFAMNAIGILLIAIALL